MTHDELVVRAVAWLRKRMQCRVVLANCGTSEERPDAIGWIDPDWSIVIECKASRSDFLRDLSKPSRRSPAFGMGKQRWYLVPGWDVVRDDTLLPAGWGVLLARTGDGPKGNQIRRLRPSADFDARELSSERETLFWQLVRAQEREERGLKRLRKQAMAQLAYEAVGR